ncbi:PorV/PorQ family protein [bacterium]|nr:PorV/PorQ family protein [bacterium]MBU1599023.1 PorV/PorQ family protein [bacterium]
MKRLLTMLVILTSFKVGAVSKGVCGAQFLKIDPVARAASMGGAFSALADDASAGYYNPAGLAQLKTAEAITCGGVWIEETRYGFIGYAAPISRDNALGVAVLYLQTPKISGYDDSNPPNKIDDFDAKDLAVSFSYSQRFSRRNYFGISAKWISQQIEKEKTYSFAIDAGEIYKPPMIDGLSLAVVVQNIGPPIKFIREEDKMPITLKLGAVYKLMDENAKLLLDLVKPLDNNWRVSCGTEWCINRNLSLRGGYNSQVFKDLGIGVSLGAGLKLGTFALDYAYVPYNELGDTHRFSFTTHFGK